MSREVAMRGRFELQSCDDCGALQYPPREVCSKCLSDDLSWTADDGLATVLSNSLLTHSFDPIYENQRMSILTAKLDSGPIIIAFAKEETLAPGGRVRLMIDKSMVGGPAIVAGTIEGSEAE